MLNKNKLTIILLAASIIFFHTCSSLKAQSNDTLTYVFFGHTYQSGAFDPEGKRVDFRLEAMDMTQFDRIWLGGDVGAEAGLNYDNLVFLDSVFGIRKPGNHWALGNHDTRNGNMEWFEEFMGRPTFYAYSKHTITTIVLNSNLSPLDCENINKQYNLIKNVCDTISTGYLIFLTHHGITKGVPGVADPVTFSHQEVQNWMASCHNDSTSYVQAIYPLLVEVESRGVDVLHIMGDTGAWYKQFHGTSVDGVDYFATGLGNGYKLQNGLPINAPDVALVFKHILSTNELLWEYVEINDL